jgi:hypothetical protein
MYSAANTGGAPGRQNLASAAAIHGAAGNAWSKAGTMKMPVAPHRISIIWRACGVLVSLVCLVTGAKGATLSETAKKADCVTEWVFISGTMYRCTTKSGALAYVNCPECATATLKQSKPSSERSKTPVTLLCISNAGGQRYSQNLVIDYSRSTVNGAVATIDENMISWKTTNAERAYTYSLNRLSGTLETYSLGVTSPTFQCDKAPPPKF